jgi:uracil phosphoribosyltransferase
MTPTRDASVSDPALRDAHFRIGQYLATEFVTKVVGLETYPIPHVQGHTTTGHRLRNEASTIIVALMRGGEPMAFGVSAAFPIASFLHAKNADDN